MCARDSFFFVGTATVSSPFILKRHDDHLRPIAVIQEQFGPVAVVKVISGQIKSYAFLLIGRLGTYISSYRNEIERCGWLHMLGRIV